MDVKKNRTNGTKKMRYANFMAKTRQIGFRLPEEEYQRIIVIYNKAKERTMGYAPLGDVIREAIGLVPLKIITKEERDSLSSKNATIEKDSKRRSA